MTTSRRLRVTLTSLLWLALCAFAVAACGGGGDGSVAPTPDTVDTDTADDGAADDGAADTADTADTSDEGTDDEGGVVADDGGADPGVADEGVTPMDDGPETEDTPPPDTGPDLSCRNNAECVDKLGDALELCDLASCVNNRCAAVKNPDCCAAASDCDDGNPCTEDTCREPGEPCTHTPVISASCCGDAQTVFFAGFEAGTLDGFTVGPDQNPGDSVTWTADDQRAHGGRFSLYLGDPTCRTYYNGTFIEGCQPNEDAEDAGRISLDLASPAINLPSDALVAGAFWLYAAVEPPTNAGGTPCDMDSDCGDDEFCDPVAGACGPTAFRDIPEADIATVLVRSGEVVRPVFTTIEVGKNTHGEFAYVLFDLSEYAGQAVQLVVRFDTLDGQNNTFEGVYVDDFSVFTYCGDQLCSGDGDCDADGDNCTLDVCTGFSNSANALCAFQQPDGDCRGCADDDDCDDGDNCTSEVCSGDGTCVFTTVEGPACCVSVQELIDDFESEAAGWQLGGEGSVSWRTTDDRATDEGSSLHFGRTGANGRPTYDNEGARSVGTALSPAVEVPERRPYLSFDLFLSTEWDFKEEYNGFDRLSIAVDGEADPLWTSDEILGSTHGLWEPITLDLAAFAGRTVQLRVEFDTVDDKDNDHSGAFIDGLHVWSGCNAPTCADGLDCDDADPCTRDTCSLGVCASADLGDQCCLEASDCNDGNSCTDDTCDDGLCAHTPTDDQNCCVDLVWTEHSFERPSDDFQVVVASADEANEKTRWQRIDDVGAAHTGEWAYYFGDTETMSLGVPGDPKAQGSLMSPPWFIPPKGSTMLDFDVRLDTRWRQINENTLDAFGLETFLETRHEQFMDPELKPDDFSQLLSFEDGGQAFREDLLYVLVVEENTENPFAEPIRTPVWYSGFLKGFTSDSTDDGSDAEYDHVRVDLTQWAGKTVQVEFFFSTYFSPPGIYGGVWLDDVSVGSVCDEGLDCVGAQDCALDGDLCTTSTCSADFTCGVRPDHGPGCCVPEAILTEGFEGLDAEALGLAVETRPEASPHNVKWHVSDVESHTGGTSIYYGDANTNTINSGDVPNRGSFTTEAFDLPAGEPLELTFWVFHQTDAFVEAFPEFNQLLVEIIEGRDGPFIPPDAPIDEAVLLNTFDDGGPTYTDTYKGRVPPLTWTQLELPLPAELAGQRVRVRISFDSIDTEGLDQKLGIFIDDLRLSTACPD